MPPLLACAVLATACSSRPPAPVEERIPGQGAPTVTQEQPVDGLYRVRRGDSLHAIAFKYGLDWRDIAAWNGITAPWVIHPDQVLRLTAPARSVTIAAAPQRQSSTRSTAEPEPVRTPQPPPVEARQPPTADAGRPVTEPAPATTSPPLATAPRPTPPPASPTADPDAWRWPTSGRLLRTFRAGDPARNGIDIVGSEGQDVVAAAPGQVVYSGNGLIGYGELIIVKHSERLLSAYAHNRRRLVAEGDTVSAGQKLAELGRNDRNETLLHFEVRLNGKPVDPLNYLPKQ